MCDVMALGELLVDFTTDGETVFTANPGGAPCNVLAILAKLGRSVSFAGKVGDDMFGHMLAGALERAGIGRGGLVLDPAAHTTLAFVQNSPDGERSFSFYRDPGADELLRPEELPREALAAARIFHFGSLSLTREPARSATQAAVRLARAGGALVSFDPNLRASLWKSLEEAKEQMLWGCSVCQVMKVSEEELAFLTGCRDMAAGAAVLRRAHPNIRLLAVTCGSAGSTAYWDGPAVSRPAFRQVRAVDTTGAGDTFWGCCLHALLDRGPKELDQERLGEMLTFANAAAGLITTKKGALLSMPEPGEIRRLAEQAQKDGHKDF